VSEEDRKPDRNASDHADRPDLAELDAFRTGEARAEVRSHVEGCERCRRVVRELGVLAGEINAVLHVPEIDVPADVDGRLRAMARARAAVVRSAARSADGKRTRSRRAIYFSWPGWVAAAATVLIAVGVATSVRRREAPGVASRLADADAIDTAVTMDIDRDGTIDIVDAYLMSRTLGSRAQAPRSWDFDRDGAVGEADVKAVAMQAVALADGGI
jgi:anti-sigma-K factor RskA